MTTRSGTSTQSGPIRSGDGPDDAQAVGERLAERRARARDRPLGVGRGAGSDHERAVDQLHPAFAEGLLDAGLDAGLDIGAAQGAVVRLAPGACVRRRRLGACVFALDVVHSHLRCSSVGHRATVTGPAPLETRCHRNGQRPGDVLGCGRAHAAPGARRPIEPSNSPRTTPTPSASARRTSASTSWRARTGRSPSTAAPAGLGSDADRRVFGTLRELAEVVLVGAGTVRAEDYGGARKPTRGRADPPPIAVVTGSADLDPGARLFTDTRVAPIVLTGPDAPADRLRRAARGGRRRRGARPALPRRRGGRARPPRPAPRALRGRAAALRRPRGRRPRRRALPHRRPGARGG